MAKKAEIISFKAIDKKQVRGKVGHTRTGACPSRGRCYHGNTPRIIARRKR